MDKKKISGKQKQFFTEGGILIDLHTHTIHSDGELLPSELIQRARKKGYRAIGLTDHADSSNLETVIKSLKNACRDMNAAYQDIICAAGVELTHIPPVLAAKMVRKARKLGAEIIVFHGETVTEPVEPGSNLAAIKAKADILAHPGRITPAEARLAAKNGVYLEITARNGHNVTNAHVAKTAMAAGAKLIFNTDTHTPQNMADKAQRRRVLRSAGLKDSGIARIIKNSEELLEKKGFLIRKST
ncbi:MAG: histidinol phosphate phosphatase domain-containing protein [Candidatus Goldiibacteriota bacterium]